ncbi:peptide/nickel transport system substrate-binding protein [Mycolicibacterium iranicum]|uniref:Peptide/nickel transport system substrate-binding protein n=1 Tax=Mycolicibacterium iranicum TaxID=912594 RepID=A0A839Q065_MYCIR|nr:ABC transporter substrate-binding protein [Mycolicibacterium iranicum]MBB2989748.1 peptide/nickel transport system substrate-binding protein [Mycolicibacterium iranicum]
MAALLALTACGGDSGGGGGTGEPVRGGTLTVAQADFPEEGMNPHVRGCCTEVQVLRNAYDSLVAIDYDESIHPWLAERWERSPDGLVYTFTLKRGVTFHDGEPFNAAAVKANFDKIVNDKEYAPSVAKSTFQTLKSTEVVDEYTVRTVLSEPTANWLNTLASLQGSQISPKSLQNPDVAAGGVGIAGTGPFILTDVVEGSELRFTRNDAYNWPSALAKHQGAAYLDELVVKIVPEPNVRAGLLTSREVDAISQVAPADIAQFDGVEGFQFEWKPSNVSPWSLYFNVTGDNTKDVRVRRALREAVDLNPIIDTVLQGSSDRAWSVVGPQSPYYDAKYENAYGGNVDLANRLLDEAGWTGRDSDGYRTNAAGQRLVIRLIATEPKPPLSTVLEAYQAELRTNAGVEVDLQFRDEGTVDVVRETNTYEAFPRAVGGVDIGVVLEKIYETGGAINGPKLEDPQVDSWLADGRTALDEQDRKAAYDKVAQFALIDDVTTLPLYTERYNTAATSRVNEIERWLDAPRGMPNFWAYDTWLGDDAAT